MISLTAVKSATDLTNHRAMGELVLTSGILRPVADLVVSAGWWNAPHSAQLGQGLELELRQRVAIALGQLSFTAFFYC